MNILFLWQHAWCNIEVLDLQPDGVPFAWPTLSGHIYSRHGTNLRKVNYVEDDFLYQQVNYLARWWVARSIYQWPGRNLGRRRTKSTKRHRSQCFQCRQRCFHSRWNCSLTQDAQKELLEGDIEGLPLFANLFASSVFVPSPPENSVIVHALPFHEKSVDYSARLGTSVTVFDDGWVGSLDEWRLVIYLVRFPWWVLTEGQDGFCVQPLAGYIARWFLLFVTYSNTRWESFPCSFSGSQMSDKQNLKTVLRIWEIGDDARNAVFEYFETDTSQERNEKKEMQ